jgi:hypothetical protein
MQRDERVNIVILDACRDNPFAAQLAAKSRAVTRGLTAIETQSASGILIAFATDPRATALDGERDGNSPFTSALLKHIETPEVSITTVMDRVRADVWETTNKKQKPWTNSSIIGEFKMNPTLKLAAVDAGVAATKTIDAPCRCRRCLPLLRSIAPRSTSRPGKSPSAAIQPPITAPISTPSRRASSRPSPATVSPASKRRSLRAVSAPPPGVTDEALKKEIGTAQTETAMKLDAKGRRECRPACASAASSRQGCRRLRAEPSQGDPGLAEVAQHPGDRLPDRDAGERAPRPERPLSGCPRRGEGRGREEAQHQTAGEGAGPPNVSSYDGEMYQRDLARERGQAYQGTPRHRVRARPAPAIRAASGLVKAMPVTAPARRSRRDRRRRARWRDRRRFPPRRTVPGSHRPKVGPLGRPSSFQPS